MNNNSLLFSLLILTKNNALIAGLSYALTITLANILGPEVFGRYSFVLVIASILSILISFGTDKTAPIMASKKTIGSVLQEIVFVRLVISTACIIGLIIYSEYSQDTAFYILCLLFSGLNLGFFFEISLKNELYSYVYLFERVVYIGGVFFVIYFFQPSLDIVFTLFLLSTLVSLIFQYYRASFEVNRIFSINWQSLQRIFLMNMPLVIIALSTFSFGGFSRIILENSLGMEQMGIYSAGWQLITIGTIFQSQVTRVWRLKISSAIEKDDKNQLIPLIKSYSIFATLPFIFLTVTLFFTSEQVVGFLFTDEYAELVHILPVLSIYYLVINLAGLVDMLWVAVGKNKLYMYINIIFGLLLLMLLFFISDNANLIDFALSTILIHMFMVFVLSIVWYRKFFRV
jgi:O-antigen/teichoic acid export membrane protein